MRFNKKKKNWEEFSCWISENNKNEKLKRKEECWRERIRYFLIKDRKYDWWEKENRIERRENWKGRC